MTASGAQPWYKSTTLIAGLVLLALGAGNWITGTIRLREHVATASLPTTAAQGNGTAVSPPSAPTSEEIEIARVRMDFYHVVASGGRLMTATGFVLVTLALARRLRPQAKRR